MDQPTRLVLPKAMLRKMDAAGIYCQTWVTLEKQARADRWVLRGVESGGSTTVTDPFIAILSSTVTGLPRTITDSVQDILLMDRQPVIKGARYKYLLVRFGPNKEIERVIVTNTVDVPF